MLLAAALLSLLVTEYARLSLRELRSLVVEPVLAFYMLRRLFPGSSLAAPVIALLAGAVGVAVVGLAGAPFGLGLSQAEGVLRLQATYPSPNHLGLMLGRTLPWVLALGLTHAGWRATAIVAGVPLILALALTYSLGAWVGAAGGVTATALALRGATVHRSRRRLLMLAAGCAVALAILAGLQAGRLSARLSEAGTLTYRLLLWQSSVAMIRDHPLLGVGLDNFLYQYQQRYIQPAALAEANLSHPHNLLLQAWLELGLLGVASLTWLLAQGLATARRRSRRSDLPARWLAAGAFGSLIDFLLHGLIDNSYFLADMALIFWLTMAVLSTDDGVGSEREGIQGQVHPHDGEPPTIGAKAA